MSLTSLWLITAVPHRGGSISLESHVSRSTHTYHETLATEIVERIRTSYFATLQAAIARIPTQYTDLS